MAHKFELKNPLLEREKYKNINKDGLEESKVELEKVIQKTIATYGQIKHLTTTLLETIDFDDKEFINRIYENESELFDTDLIELKESIKEIGIINMVYLLEKENGKKVIISGLRRLLASRELLREGHSVKGNDRIVVFEKNTPYELLDKISVDENTKRKNLKILELSYKLNVEAKKKNKTIDEMLSDYQISKSHYKRIKKAMSYPLELKEVVEKIGITKAEALNKIIEILKKDTEISEIIERYIDCDREMLTHELKLLKKDKTKQDKVLKEKFIIQKKNNSTQVVIQKSLTEKETELLTKVLNIINSDEKNIEEILKKIQK